MQEIVSDSTESTPKSPQKVATRVAGAERPSAMRYPRLALLHRATLAFNSSLELSDVLHTVLEELREALRADGWGVWLVDHGSGDIVCQHAAGPGHQLIAGRRMTLDEGIIGLTVSTGESIYVADTARDPRYSSRVASQAQVQHGSLLCAPLLLRPPGAESVVHASGSSAMGAVVVISEAADAFSTDELSLLEAMAAAAATAIANAQLYRRANGEIEERRRVERALRHSESLYRTVIETSPDAVVVTDLHNAITMCNQRTLELHGYERRAELLGRSFLTLFAPESRAEAHAMHRRVLEGEFVASREFTLLRRGDLHFQAEYVASLIAAESGRPVSVVGFARDITVRKEAENTIRRHNRELRILNSIATQLSQAGDLDRILATALDQTLKVLHVDTGWVSLSGDGPGSPAASSCADAVARRGEILNTGPEDEILALRQWIDERLHRTGKLVLVNSTDLPQGWLGGGAPCQLAAVPLASQGNILGMLVVAGLDDGRPRTIRSGQLQLLSAIGHQVSIAVENARLTSEVAEIAMLRELNQMRSELIANVSHDLRSPLGLIKMACSTLQRDDVVLDDEIVEDLLDDIQSQTDRLSRLVEGILDLGRLESGRHSLHLMEIDIGMLSKQVLSEFQRGLDGYRLALLVGEGSLTALVDPDRIDQVIRNLLDNAVKYTPGEGEIVVEVLRNGSTLSISVADPGIGIPADQRELVFERFYRVNSPLVRQVGGVGLGLPTCKAIVEAHGGTIRIEDGRHQGGEGGTTVVFSVPAAPLYLEVQA